MYRGKLQGRNRVVSASTEPLLLASERGAKLRAVVEDGEHVATLPPAEQLEPAEERRTPKPRTLHGPTFFQLSTRLAFVVASVSVIGIGAGAAGLIWGSSTDYVGLLAVLALVGAGQALSFELAEVEGSLSVSVVGSLAGAALFDYRAALPLAVTIAVVDWSARRNSLHTVVYNIGTMALSSLAAASVFTIWAGTGNAGRLVVAAIGLLAGAVYFLVNMGLLSFASGVEGHESPWAVFHERFAWLLPHYVVYGFIGAVMAIGYEAVGLYGLAVFAVPLLLMRKTQEAYLKHTQKSAQKLREAAETIQSQNVSLEQANKLLRERSTAAMESLSATVDARDSYTAGHSRRVQQLALAIGRELGLSQAELDLLGHAALFHDIGKLAIPDAILLKPASLTGEEWALMQRHADEGARIIDRLGFLQDAVPCDPPPPRAVRRHGLSGPDRGRGDPARRPDHPCRRCTRLDADDAHLPRRAARERGARRGQGQVRHAVLSAVRRGARPDPAARVRRRRPAVDRAPGAARARPRGLVGASAGIRLRGFRHALKTPEGARIRGRRRLMVPIKPLSSHLRFF